LNIRKDIKQNHILLKELEENINQHKLLIELLKKDLVKKNKTWVYDLEIRINNELAKQLPEAIRKTIAHVEFKR